MVIDHENHENPMILDTYCSVPVKTILFRIFVDVIVWTELEFEVTEMVGSDIDAHIEDVTWEI